MRRFSILCGVLLAVAGTALAQADPATLPAHDRHEGMLVAADPCNDATRAKARFGKASPIPAGIVPIEVFFRNETQQPLRINLATIRLEIAPAGRQQQHIEPLDASEVALLIAHPGGTPNPESRRSRFPRRVPLPSNDKKAKELESVLRPLSLDADVIPPAATVHGFLFFDVSHDFSVLAAASLYLPDVRVIPGNQALTYFEVDLRSASRP
jgi:hypothetical protein